VNKCYPLPQIIGFNFITLRDIFYLSEVVLAPALLYSCISTSRNKQSYFKTGCYYPW